MAKINRKRTIKKAPARKAVAAQAKPKPEPKAKGQEPGKPGRPEWEVTPERILEIEKYCSLQITLEEVAACIGISYQTLNEKSKSYPEISEAIKRGRAKSVAAVAQTIVEAAMKENNLTAAIFFLKCHGGWTEKQAPQEHQHGGEIKITRTIRRAGSGGSGRES